MIIRRLPSLSEKIVLAFGIATTTAPAYAASPPQARLVHCGQETCLRLSGHRPRSAVTVRIGGRDLAVDGGRRWRATIPLETARTWAISSGYSLVISLVDTQLGTEAKEEVILPPGALGQRVELATLVVRAY